ncbi:hypothetical protein Fcan01_10166 [Folsomia candida]|uniref:Uncharacterized protein n=1 Tax=Folsomia candida TaxID=158441 RepID=A0A226ECX1_FOLCA|nr:hypothetical protein Fcan01_10166 [Folsomia candida]
MWRVLETFLDQYRNQVPYRISVHQEELTYVPLSKKQGIFVHFSFAVFLLHTIYCFLRVVWLWKTGIWRQNEDQDLEIILTYILLFLIFLPLSFVSMSFVVSIRPSIAPYIVNPILGLKILANEIKACSDGMTNNLCPPTYAILIRAMQCQLWLSKYPLPMLFVGLVLCRVDPFYPVATYIVSMVSSPSSLLISILLFLASYLTRTILIIIFVNELLKAGNAYFIVGLLVVCSTSEIMQLLNSLKYEKGILRVRTLTMREISFY